jgi:hypothetical protein
MMLLPTLLAMMPAITSESLRQPISHPKWLSLPHSRIVVNPRFGGYGQDPPGNLIEDTPLGMDLAYYAGEEPVRLPGFWRWQSLQLSGSSSTTSLKLDLKEPAGWITSGLAVVQVGDGVRLSPTGDYGSLDRTVEVDLGQSPLLRVEIPERTGNWALKVNDGSQEVDIALIPDTDAAGQFVANVAQATGWRGIKKFTVRFFAVGRGRNLTLTDLRFFGDRGSLRPLASRTTWAPHEIATTAATSDGRTVVEGSSLLSDPSTVAQRLRITSKTTSSLMLTGDYRNGSVRWDARRRCLIFKSDRLQSLISFSRPARWLGIRPTSLEWTQMGSGPAEPPLKTGSWGLAFDGLRVGDEIVVVARFSPSPEESLKPTPMTPLGFARARDRQARNWNRWLASVPHPQDFTVRAVDPLGVTPEQVRRTYYDAWAFLLGGVLPPMPENGYPYPQLPTGKPSLWAEGAPRARPSAQWESFVAMQTMALVDPTTAWRAYEGMMTLVGPDGSIAGEGLPSCHVQTAWVLYNRKRDTVRLRRAYPALRRLLLWKASDPRWIHKGATPPGQKDQQFVLFALMDMGYARKIASVLKMPEEAAFWDRERAALAQKFHRWFWAEVGGPSYRIFHEPTEERSGPDNPWNLTSLALPPDILSLPERESLLRVFRARLDPRKTFLIDGLSRYADYQGTARGLYRYGFRDLAAMMADASMRDATRSGEFAEFYDQSGALPRPAGVRPSVFGARHAIDGVLLHNGLVYDEGPLEFLPVDHAGGVRNLHTVGSKSR